ncbi:hypothetical protein FISHEDRAFT_74366 [Fistulina hepatica ATCC 64428]|uniref:RRM domain-containing protein n=1 Tax=Fistulina hepatica ATCC 64428 TaxID=1128425 RepID=A0A0D7ACN2_9AGAR|nr:hypothetical protein FISHEDRAFT_74366 [Fistulina hepatica ATCC 64428]
MSSESYTVKVSGIDASTTEQQLHEFFSFCGSIKSVERTGSDATIHFEKPTAAKTALMLNGGTLGGSTLSVTSEVDHPDVHETDETTPIQQTDKPRAAIAAEYVAKGYILSDQILQRAIELDKQKGISTRFLNYLQTLDKNIGAKAIGPDQTVSSKLQEQFQAAKVQARTVDEQQGLSKTATGYYEKALASPFGQKVLQFYTTTSKQVFDIHEEARRIQEQHRASQTAAASATEVKEASTAPAPTASAT